MVALALPAAAMAWPDMRGRAMMGDTGSNALGAALGLTLALDGGVIAKALAVAFLAALHIICEKYSLTAIIERCPALKKLDGLLGVR
jgi:UDP-N-acetylmuramyl pentapeptide phosphotransferase/UDP-N-acetylglucosamine-1-phosphate transferase